VGESVEAIVNLFPVCSSATLHPTAPRVYMTFVDNDESPGNGVRVVWDYQESAWFVDYLGDPDTSSTTAPPRFEWMASSSLGNVVYWVTAAGRVYQEATTAGNTCADAGQWVTMKVQTPWLKSTAQGYARFWKVRIKGNIDEPANVTITLGMDEGTYTETTSLVASQVQAFDRYPEFQTLITPGNSKAMALQITLQDANPGSFVTGQGFSWIVASLEIGVDERGYPNLPAGQRA
jgi:hypothetical protein